jgi:cadmium resistance protein CadD (predicted permease)
MSLILIILAASVTTFAATNLDDIFLLTVFFARRVPTRRIVTGQYLGFAAIVAVSLVVVWGVALAIPRDWIRLLGILPLAVGIKELLQMRKTKSRRAVGTDGSLSLISIAAITLANGADNVGVYVPFFLVSRTHLLLVLVVYGLLVLVWCAAGRWFGSHALVLKSLDRWGHWIVPFVLIGLGSYVLLFTSRAPLR